MACGVCRSGVRGALANEESGEAYQLAQTRHLISQREYREAINLASDALVELPRNAELYSLLGQAHHLLGELDAAGLAYDCALELDPAHIGALELQGQLYVELGLLNLATRNPGKLEAACGQLCDGYTRLKAIILRVGLGG